MSSGGPASAEPAAESNQDPRCKSHLSYSLNSLKGGYIGDL